MSNHPVHFPGRSTAGDVDTTMPTPEQIAKWMSHPREAQGRLQHHDQECDECAGTGLDDSDPNVPEDERDPCPFGCEQGQHRWGSWYVDDKSDCNDCGEDKPVGRMFSADGPDSIEYVCFTCYVKIHVRACGCDKFDWAVKALGL